MFDRIQNENLGDDRAPLHDNRTAEARPKVLLVDDNDSVRESLGLLLRMAGFEVLETDNAADALAATRAGRPDLVVTDLQMPDMHGSDLIRSIRGAEAPVSGNSAPESSHSGIRNRLITA